MKRAVAALVFAVLLGAAQSAMSTDDRQSPNILLITCDNLGYGDLPCHNPKSNIRAPHLGRLALQGARLTGFYTASPTRTVSRACLLTGRIAQRHGLGYQLPGEKGNYGIGLDHREKTLGQWRATFDNRE